MTTSENNHELCVFFDSKASTNEDVFPLWLQHSYKLFDQRLNLLDGSSIPYRKIKIRVCSKCNNETLSKIEQKIKKGVATELEYYLWMLKIYIGILYKETQLISYKSENVKPIVNISGLKNDLGIAKNFFSVFKNEGSFNPNLPGSVIRVKRTGKERFFDYSDILEVPIVGIAIPNEFVFVIPFDKRRTSRITDINKIPRDMSSLRFRHCIADMGYDEFRWDDSYSSFIVDDKVQLTSGSYLIRQPKEFKDKEYIGTLKAVGIKGERIGDKWKITWDENRR